MAISVAWQTVSTITAGSSTSLYTVPSTGAFSTYARDLVITNGGTVNSFVSLGASASAASTAASFVVPPGGTVLLTQCQVPAASIIYGMSNGASPISIGYATNVSYI